MKVKEGIIIANVNSWQKIFSVLLNTTRKPGHSLMTALSTYTKVPSK